MTNLIRVLTAGLILSLAPSKINNNSIKKFTPKVWVCEGKIQPDYTFIATVKATMYHPVPGQTDDTPDIVADGTKFDIPTAGDLDWIAVSRDLHYRWGGPLRFGDIVYIYAKEKTGFYLVKDTMNKRFTKRIDFLESPGTKIYKYPSALLYLAKSQDFNEEELWTLSINQQIIIP